jgi:CheY-like chemotaxis protein
VLSDIIMPGGINGLELARHVRGHRPDVAVVLTTGYYGEGADPYREGFHVLRKPFDAKLLASTLREALKVRGLAPGA